MLELTNDPFYGMIKNYDRCMIDYCLVGGDLSYCGYRTHKDAVIFSIKKVIERYADHLSEAETGLREERPEDFKKVNEILFPRGMQSLEVYEWTTDWSNYFDAGHEWWGAACWSVYDKTMNRFVVLMVSATD